MDLEIERELQEMVENGESDKETKSKHFKILSFVSMIVIAVIAIIRFIQNDINIQMPTHMSRHILYFKIVVKMLEHLYLFV